MTSAESIGDCSLDLLASASSGALANGLGTSECTLRSSNVLPYASSSEENAQMPVTDNCASAKENRAQEKAGINGCRQPTRECTVAEIKLPSYVSISCAINGYTNYSKFCRSRDSSPARAAFRKSSLENNVVHEENHKSGDFSLDSNFKCTRSHSDCNGTVSSIFKETRQVTVSKQLQIPLKSTRKYVTAQEIMIGEELSTNNKLSENGIHDTFEHEHLFDKFSLAQEVGNGGPKSLVQQRIESLYGNSKLKETTTFSQRESRIDNCKAKTKVAIVSTSRSPSCPAAQSVRKVNGSTPPVFRHLTKDFRMQLQDEIPQSSSFKTPESSILIHDMPKGVSESCSKRERTCSSFIHFLNGESTDECDRAPIPDQEICGETDQSCVKKSIAETNPDCNGEPDKAGYSFLEAMDVEKKAIQVEILKLENELKNSDIPEDACGKIRAACGKANLLLSQKFEQFKELCLKNINEMPSVPFYTTASDLAGFWDMVMLQVSDVKATFKDIYTMKANNWEEICTPKSAPLPSKVKRHPIQSISKSNPCTPKRSTKSVELARAREEARKQLLKAKKKGRQQNGNTDEAEIAIFTPN